MSEEDNNPGHQLLMLAMLLFVLASNVGIWQLYIVGSVLLAIGILLTISHAVKTQQSVAQQTARGLDPFLPTSKGVAFLEDITGYLDNPDTAIMEVGPQPEGSRPVIGGVSSSEFSGAYDSAEFSPGSSQGAFVQGDRSHEFVIGFSSGEFSGEDAGLSMPHFEHSHIPRSWYDPVSEWHDPVSAWYRPFD